MSNLASTAARNRVGKQAAAQAKLADTMTPVTSLKPNSQEVTPVIGTRKKKVENLKISIPPPKDKGVGEAVPTSSTMPKTPGNAFNKSVEHRSEKPYTDSRSAKRETKNLGSVGRRSPKINNTAGREG